MLSFDLTHNGAFMPSATWEFASGKGVPDAEIAAAARKHFLTEFDIRIEQVRLSLDAASAGKLAAYRVKEEIARDESMASSGELAMIDAEAEARGTDRAGLFAIILARAGELRTAVLSLEVVNAQAKAMIDGAADTEQAIETAWTDAIAALVAAKASASTLINGA